MLCFVTGWASGSFYQDIVSLSQSLRESGDPPAYPKALQPGALCALRAGAGGGYQGGLYGGGGGVIAWVVDPVRDCLHTIEVPSD